MNIAEIARRAGVSRSTVSYVLSGKRPVSDPIRERVMREIEAAGYRPSATARALAHGQTRTIGLVIPPMGRQLSVDQLRFVGAVAHEAACHDYDILLSPSGEQHQNSFERMIGERRVDGVIVMETLLHDHRVAALLDHDMPFITIGRTSAEESHGWVDLDYDGLVDRAVRLLHETGHRRVALVNRPQRLLDREYGPAYRAADAFAKATAELGLRGTALACEDDDEAGAGCLDEALRADPDVTALLSINERSLTGMMTALAERGLAVPADLSVLAITSARNATAQRPAVSGADVPAADMGGHAVRTLLAQLSDPASGPGRVLLTPPFVDRGSVAPPAA